MMILAVFFDPQNLALQGDYTDIYTKRYSV